jgi:hypothetical protein
MANHNHTLALIVASPGLLREGLRAALSAIPHLDEIIEVDTTASAVRLFAGRTPALVLVSGAGRHCRTWARS